MSCIYENFCFLAELKNSLSECVHGPYVLHVNHFFVKEEIFLRRILDFTFFYARWRWVLLHGEFFSTQT